MPGQYVIVGAGQAGQALAARLRELDAECSITLIGEEPVPPYQRPPLSKKYLLGEMDLERLYLRPLAYYADERIDLRLGRSVTRIDRASRTVDVGGEIIPYEALALTTGARPRRLPAELGGDLPGVHAVRTLADVDAIRPEFQPGRRCLIVGGGYIGLEAAAVAARKGLHVTLIEAAPRILQRVAAPETSDYFRALHQGEGVTIRESTALSRLFGDDRVAGAVLADGSVVEADFVIIGIGILPDTRLAEAAGLDCENGIRVDEFCRTSDPDIFAAGDCAAMPWHGGRLRLESVGNAIDMSECSAENMLGQSRAYVPLPWFWSDQYDTKLQIAGLSMGYDQIVRRPGEGGAVSFWYYAGDRLLAVDAMNDSRAYMVGKRLIEEGKSPVPAAVADVSVDIKRLLRA